jgi:hypothetical protein
MNIAVILGGPSVKGVPISAISADLFIGANWSFLLGEVDINVVVDYRCAEAISADPRFKAWVENGGICYFCDHAAQQNRYPGMITVKSTYPNWPIDGHHPEDGLYCRSHAGLTALHLATLWCDCEGDDSIQIFGLDLNADTKTGKTENWHGEHDKKWAADADASYPEMIRATDEAKAKIPAEMLNRIVNMNPDSAYTGFRKAYKLVTR